MKKIIQSISGIAAAGVAACMLSACISVSENSVEAGKQISVMSQQATTTCGQGNVDKVTTTSFTCKSGR